MINPALLFRHRKIGFRCGVIATLALQVLVVYLLGPDRIAILIKTFPITPWVTIPIATLILLVVIIRFLILETKNT